MNQNHEDDQPLNANEAVKYLAKRWGVASYDIRAFKMLRKRRGIKPTFGSRTATFWSKADLDKIEAPDKHRLRGPRKKIEIENEEDDGEARGRSSSVMVKAGSLPASLLGVAS